MQENATPSQQYPGYYLCVPESRATSLLATIPTERIGQEVQAGTFIVDSKRPENGTLPGGSPFANGAQPMRVFSPSLFTGMVC